MKHAMLTDGETMSEALALRELAAAIERRDALLKFLNDEHCEGQLAGSSGLTLSCYWASNCIGHKELMTELTRIIRARVPDLLGAVRATMDDEVEQCRKVLAAASGVRVLDGCEQCGGTRGGVPGNENIVNGRKLCDYCHADAGVMAAVPTDAQLDELWEREGLVAQHTLHDMPQTEWDAALRRSFARLVLTTYGVRVDGGSDA
jgi:hypothetical protein